MTLCYSRHQYLDIVFDQKAVTWTALHMRAFAYFGGVPHVIIPDNLKAAVIRTAFGHGNDISLHRGYRALARHYDFRVDPTPPRSPQKKGKVERSGGYAKHNFFKTHTSVDLDTDRKALWRWNDEIAAKRVHSVTRRQPMPDPIPPSPPNVGGSLCPSWTGTHSPVSDITVRSARMGTTRPVYLLLDCWPISSVMQLTHSLAQADSDGCLMNYNLLLPRNAATK